MLPPPLSSPAATFAVLVFLCAVHLATGSATPVWAATAVALLGLGLSARRPGGRADVSDAPAPAREFDAARQREAIGVVADGVAHQLNSLLAAVNGGCFLLSERLTGDPAALGLVRSVEDACRAAGQVTARLSDLDARPPAPEGGTPVAAALARAADALRAVLSATPVVTSAVGEAGRVRMDPGALERLLLNAAAGARDAPPGSPVALTAARESDGGREWVVMTAEYGGAGPAGGVWSAPPERLHERLHASGPLDLCLSVAARWAARAGGRLDAERFAGGTRVRVRLRAVIDDD